DHGVRGGHDAGDLHLLTIQHGGNARGDLVLPVVALVNDVVEPLALRLALEATDPHVHAGILLAHEAAEDDHAHLHLEGNDFLLHALDPLLLLAGADAVLTELEEHVVSFHRVDDILAVGDSIGIGAGMSRRACGPLSAVLAEHTMSKESSEN